jgi:hypothetical protein
MKNDNRLELLNIVHRSLWYLEHWKPLSWLIGLRKAVGQTFPPEKHRT